MAYYNEIDPYAARWLRNLIGAGHIAGDVDQRSILDVRPDDLREYAQCHFFAGIGGWSHALRLAGWPDYRPVWTGSCPCQPFSAAGKGKAADDERHLWPAWFSLIRECRPPIIFGEQVEAAIGWGWLDAVFSDLEAEGYACGTTVLPACSVGAPHIRNRVCFVAHADAWGRGLDQRSSLLDGERPALRDDTDGRGTRVMANTDPARCGTGRPGEAGSGRDTTRVEPTGLRNAWSDCVWLPCTDGKARPTQPGLQPLADGVSGRVGRLRAYGNAIVPQVAAEFIRAVME